MASGPSRQVITWKTYDISGFTFYTKSKDQKSMTQNSGIRCEAIDDKTGDIITYFGFIEDIWELDYGTFQILCFDVNGLKINMSQWIIMGSEFLI